jgi:hypothetical protein
MRHSQTLKRMDGGRQVGEKREQLGLGPAELPKFSAVIDNSTNVTTETAGIDLVRLDRPPRLPDHQWFAIDTEVQRLRRSVGTRDGSQACSDIKCVVESIA